ncbi:putative acetyltransferase [Leucobacter luti]|uniref:acetyltransferase n=1 Tax=Leucobacter luti TaxID=340320 RepID=UPI001045794B|nr:acetyltransferase [Leucobacter luti]MCW2288704.1 putative acetyltransferase [Leucobacter luti]TCK45141.1 putative acetyltransferase [Leucobacter luti]
MQILSSDLKIRASHGASEYPVLVEIWRSAVDATHDFLAAADRERIEAHLAADYFPAVQLLVAEHNGTALGFAGSAAGNLEMLFVHDDARGTGIGSALLFAALSDHGVVAVDVNEQNPGAHGFYLHHGFVEVGRSEQDAEGNPYPLLHLQRATESP